MRRINSRASSPLCFSQCEWGFKVEREGLRDCVMLRGERVLGYLTIGLLVGPASKKNYYQFCFWTITNYKICK